jgi:hypothetical protein
MINSSNTDVLTFTGSGYSGLVTSSRLSNGSSIVTTGGRFSGDSANLLIRENQVWKQDRQDNKLSANSRPVTWSKPPKRTKRAVEMNVGRRYVATVSLVHRRNIDSVVWFHCSWTDSVRVGFHRQFTRLWGSKRNSYPLSMLLYITHLSNVSSFSSRCLFYCYRRRSLLSLKTKRSRCCGLPLAKRSHFDDFKQKNDQIEIRIKWWTQKLLKTNDVLTKMLTSPVHPTRRWQKP